MSKKSVANGRADIKAPTATSSSYKITGSGVSVVASGNFVRSAKVQRGVSEFRKLRKKSAGDS